MLCIRKLYMECNISTFSRFMDPKPSFSTNGYQPRSRSRFPAAAPSLDRLPPEPPDRSTALSSYSAATCKPPSSPLIPYLQGGVPRTLQGAPVLTASQSLYQPAPES